MNPMYFINEIIWIHRMVPLSKKLACTRTRAHTSTFYTERMCADAYVFTCIPVVWRNRYAVNCEEFHSFIIAI